jgi:AraC family transcriptional regulator
VHTDPGTVLYVRNMTHAAVDTPSVLRRHGHLALPFGRFYGREDMRRSAPGLEMSVLRADPYRVVERHSHEEAHFVLVLDGLYVSSAGGATPVSSGTALIFNPAGTTHRDRFEARNDVIDGRFLTLSIARELLEATSVRGLRHARAVSIVAPDATSAALRLAAACSHDDADASCMRESLALELLTHVASDACAGASSNDAPEWLLRAREHLDDALGDAVHVADVARTAGVHPVHLARVFRRHTGLTPGEYLRRRRLSHAGVLLCETSRTLADIALACGFSDQSHFTNAFRRAHGCTPSVFRLSRRS